MAVKKPKATLADLEKLTLRLASLEKPEIRAAIIRRLAPLIAKAPVLVLHQICQQLEMLNGEEG